MKVHASLITTGEGFLIIHRPEVWKSDVGHTLPHFFRKMSYQSGFRIHPWRRFASKRVRTVPPTRDLVQLCGGGSFRRAVTNYGKGSPEKHFSAGVLAIIIAWTGIVGPQSGWDTTLFSFMVAHQPRNVPTRILVNMFVGRSFLILG
jgi:hypothetical protein